MGRCSSWLVAFRLKIQAPKSFKNRHSLENVRKTATYFEAVCGIGAWSCRSKSATRTGATPLLRTTVMGCRLKRCSGLLPDAVPESVAQSRQPAARNAVVPPLARAPEDDIGPFTGATILTLLLACRVQQPHRRKTRFRLADSFFTARDNAPPAAYNETA